MIADDCDGLHWIASDCIGLQSLSHVFQLILLNDFLCLTTRVAMNHSQLVLNIECTT